MLEEVLKRFTTDFATLFFHKDMRQEDEKKWNSFLTKTRESYVFMSYSIFYAICVPILFITTRSIYYVLPTIMVCLFTVYLLKKKIYNFIFIMHMIYFFFLPFYRFFSYGPEFGLSNTSFLQCLAFCIHILSVTKKQFMVSSIISFIILIWNNIYAIGVLETNIDDMQKSLTRFKIQTIGYSLIQILLFILSNTQHEKILQQMWLTQAKMSEDKETHLLLSLSHELQNPLNVLINNLDFAKEKLDSLFSFLDSFVDNPKSNHELIIEKSQKILNDIKFDIKVAKNSAEMLSHTIFNILDKSKLDAGELEFSPCPRKLNQIISKYWEFISYKLNKNDLNGDLLIDPLIPNRLRLDTHFFSQLILNLKTNAIKYSQGQDVQTIITWIPESEKPKELLFSHDLLEDYQELNQKRSKIRRKTIAQQSILNEIWSSEGLVPTERRAVRTITYDSKNIFCHNNLNELDLSTRDRKKYIKINKLAFLSDFPADKYLSSNDNKYKRGYLKIEVYDSGPGIHNPEKIFDRALGQKKLRLGLGLGLWITKAMCKIMNAEIKVFTELGKGTQFVVLLPVESVPDEPNTMKEVQTPDKISVLVVDDDLFNREICKKYLKDLGVKKIAEAQNGREAITMCSQNNDYNLIFMDLEMPIMGGKESAKLIRAYERVNNKPNVKIVIATGNCNKSEKDECMDSTGEIRADLFIRKPLSKSDFAEAISLVKK